MIGFSKATVKSVQRGVYAGAGGTVTISAVDTTKAVVMSMSKSSSGYVAATGNAAGSLNYGSYAGWTIYAAAMSASGGQCSSSNVTHYLCNTVPLSSSLSGGSTCLTAKQFSAVLTNATTITCDGPVEWQVIEYS